MAEASSPAEPLDEAAATSNETPTTEPNPEAAPVELLDEAAAASDGKEVERRESVRSEKYLNKVAEGGAPAQWQEPKAPPPEADASGAAPATRRA
eukprot:1167596-Pyramimonas_sp.AAC.1